jgi:hypothetical protein
MVAVDALEIDRVLCGETQDVVGVAGHQETLHDLLRPCDGPFEILQRLARLAGQRDLDEDIHVPAELLLVEQRDVVLDDAGVLQRPGAAQAGGGGQADPFGKVRVGDAAVGLKER